MARGLRKSLVGERFGKLVVKEYKGTDNFRNSLWVCECDCGRTTIEKGTLLTKGKIVSCGECSNRLAKNPIPTKNELFDKSLIGARYGKLVIEDLYLKTDEETGKQSMFAKCKCDCGNEKEVLLTTLKRGATLSCGCLKKELMTSSKFRLSDDFIGQRFGKLVVMGYDEEQKKWKCQCDCGNIKYLKKSNLTTNGYKSCGHCGGKASRNRKKKEE